jgi:hypothetical protein
VAVPKFHTSSPELHSSLTSMVSITPPPPHHRSVILTHAGTAAIFHGAALNNSVFTPIIDNLPEPVQSLPSSNPPSYGVWYRTPDLPPGPHTVIIHDIPAVTVDFIVVDVDPLTVFPPTTSVLISDSDPSIEYTGSWHEDFSHFQTLQPFTFIGDYSTRSSCNPGDTLSLPFSGSFFCFRDTIL